MMRPDPLALKLIATAIVVVVWLLSLALIDWALFRDGGDATISQVYAHVYARRPAVVYPTLAAIGLLIGHLVVTHADGARFDYEAMGRLGIKIVAVVPAFAFVGARFLSQRPPGRDREADGFPQIGETPPAGPGPEPGTVTRMTTIVEQTTQMTSRGDGTPNYPKLPDSSTGFPPG